jgi:hypothetical protein
MVLDGKTNEGLHHAVFDRVTDRQGLCGMRIDAYEGFMEVRLGSPELYRSRPPEMCPECFKVIMRMRGLPLFREVDGD